MFKLTLPRNHMLRQKRVIRCWLLLLALTFLGCTTTSSALAQSRRRTTDQGSATPTPVERQEPERNSGVAPSATTRPAPLAKLVVAEYRYSSSMNLNPGYLDIATEACVARLKASPSLEVSTAGNLTRKEAIDQAKAEHEAYLVWLETAVDEEGRGAANIGLGQPTPSRIAIQYTIFTPGTGKSKASGRAYLETLGAKSGKVGVGLPTVTERMPTDYLMKKGGREVADRVMGVFHVSAPEH